MGTSPNGSAFWASLSFGSCSDRSTVRLSLIKALGLRKESEVQSKTTNGVRRRAVFEPVRLE